MEPKDVCEKYIEILQQKVLKCTEHADEVDALDYPTFDDNGYVISGRSLRSDARSYRYCIHVLEQLQKDLDK